MTEKKVMIDYNDEKWDYMDCRPLTDRTCTPLPNWAQRMIDDFKQAHAPAPTDPQKD